MLISGYPLDIPWISHPFPYPNARGWFCWTSCASPKFARRLVLPDLFLGAWGGATNRRWWIWWHWVLLLVWFVWLKTPGCYILLLWWWKAIKPSYHDRRHKITSILCFVLHKSVWMTVDCSGIYHWYHITAPHKWMASVGTDSSDFPDGGGDHTDEDDHSVLVILIDRPIGLMFCKYIYIYTCWLVANIITLFT